MKHLQLLLALVPGVGQVHRGDAIKGTVLFFLFAFFANGILMSPFWFPAPMFEHIRMAFVLGTSAIWIYSFVDSVMLWAEAQNESSIGAFAEPAEGGSASGTQDEETREKDEDNSSDKEIS